MKRIDEQFLETPFYGSRQMKKHLWHQGIKIGRDRVRRLMRKKGLVAIYQKPKKSQPHPQHKTYTYLLRSKAITRPNQMWCADITYIPMRRGFLYLVAIMDWHISGDSGLFALRDRVAAILADNDAAPSVPAAPLHSASFRADYVSWLLEYSGAGQLASMPGRKPLKIVADAGNGCAGLVLKDLMASLPFEFVCRQMQPETPCCPNAVQPLLRLCVSLAQIWASPGTAILTAAFFMMQRAILLRAITA